MIHDWHQFLSSAVRAPSGDNCQPWRFEVQGQTLKVFNRPERDTSVYNLNQRASYIAHGALIENMSVLANAQGARAEVSIFPDASISDLVCSIRFTEGTKQASSLHEAIASRSSNRRRFSAKQIDEEVFTRLSASIQGDQMEGLGSKIKLIKPGRLFNSVAELVATHDRILFECPELHQFLFDHIRWSDAQATGTADGLDLKTLELSLPDRLAFRLLKYWKLTRILNGFGLSRITGAKARGLVKSSALLGVVTIDAASPGNFVMGGRALQRLWLNATQQGLSVHLMAGAALLSHQVLEGTAYALTDPQKRRLRKAWDRLGIADVPIAIIRLGYSAPPSARSVRQAPEAKL